MREEIVKKFRSRGWALLPCKPDQLMSKNNDKEIAELVAAGSLEPHYFYLVYPDVEPRNRGFAQRRSLLEKNFPRILHDEHLVPFLYLFTEYDGCRLVFSDNYQIFIPYDQLEKELKTLNRYDLFRDRRN